MKVYIVLEYIDHDGLYETCMVNSVYARRVEAALAAARMQFKSDSSDRTYHVIQKTLKGKR